MGNAWQLVEALSQLVECEPLDVLSDRFSGLGNLYPKRAGRTHSAPTQQDVLADTIEAEIIPRLMFAHRSSQQKSTVEGFKKRRSIGLSEVSEFARLVVQHDVGVAETYVDILRKQGVSLESVFMEILAPAAKHLGELWLLDTCTFVDVTVGLSRIHQLVHKLSHQFESEGQASSAGRSIVLAPVPGEQHGLGLLLVEEFFRRDGWDVWAPTHISGDDLIQAVSAERFDIAGISVTCGVLLDDLANVIDAIRAGSQNRDIVVMVGGRFVNDHPDIVQRVGADATDVDGSQATMLFDNRLAQLRRPA